MNIFKAIMRKQKCPCCKEYRKKDEFRYIWDKGDQVCSECYPKLKNMEEFHDALKKFGEEVGAIIKAQEERHQVDGRGDNGTVLVH